MIFIPAIDLIDGKCVRLLQGDYNQKTDYPGDPVVVAKEFQEQGARYIHIVDLDGARDGSWGNISVIKKIVGSVGVPVEVGGGVRDRERVRVLLDSGADRVILGTIIVKAPSLVKEMVQEFGSTVAAGIDSKDGHVRVSGWTQSSKIRAVDLGKKVKEMGFSLIVHTDISMDGMMKGPNIEGAKNMAFETGLPIILAGGVSSIDDIKKVRQLKEYGIVGVISGKAIYEGALSIKEAYEVLEGSE